MDNPNREIVIVDDEIDILDILNEDFQKAGFKVFCSENISSGLALVQSRRPSILITDLKLPLGGGKDLFEEVLSFPAGIRPKVIFITGNPMISVENAFDQGAEGYFTKPFETSSVISDIKRILEPLPQRWRGDSGKKKSPTKTIGKSFSSFESAESEHLIGLGRGGMFLHLSDRLPSVGDLVSFDLKFKNGRAPIRGEGCVRWVREFKEQDLPPGVGIEFYHLDDASAGFLVGTAKVLEKSAYIPKC